MRHHSVRLIVIFLVAFTFSSCKKKLPPASSPQSLIGGKLPRVDVTDLDGASAKLKGTRGTPTILALWATWCDPCHEEIPALVEWWRSQDAVALQTLAVESPTVDMARVQRFIDDASFDGVSWRTTTGNASALGVRALPVVYLLDGDGVVRDVHEGFSGVDELMTWLERALAEL